MNKQKGVFSIELSFVLIGICALLFFIFDLGYQVVQKSQLSRTSYSIASVLKERKAFFTKGTSATNWDINANEVQEMLHIAQNLLGKNKDDLRVNIGFKSGKRVEQTYQAGNSEIACSAQSIGNDITEGSKHDLNVYRVTVCRRVPAFFEKAIAGQVDKDSRVLKSTSLFVGR